MTSGVLDGCPSDLHVQHISCWIWPRHAPTNWRLLELLFSLNTAPYTPPPTATFYRTYRYCTLRTARACLLYRAP